MSGAAMPPGATDADDLPEAARLSPLILATMASQSLMAVLAPTIVAIGNDLGGSVGAVGQARSLTAAVAIASSAVIMARVDAIGVPRLLALGGGLGVAACAAIAASPTLAVFLIAHALTGLGFACLLSAGFAGVAAFPPARRPWAIGYVAGANALAWIVVNPSVGALTEAVSWRAAQAVPAAIALAALLAAPSAAPVPQAPAPRLLTLFAAGSARRWIGVELIAYGAWTALLTFVGAFFIVQLGAGEAATGWFLAAGGAAYFVASTRSGALANVLPRRHLVAAAAVAMAALVAVQLNAAESVAVAVALFCLIGLAAGVRTPASGGLGLEQLPDHPGAMMGARTAATQLGYLLGAVIGGAVIAGPGYGMLGFVLAGGMLVSGWLVLRVRDPLEGAAGDAVRAQGPSSP